MNCPHCANEIPDGSKFCNHCGTSPQVQPKKAGSGFKPILWLVLAAFVVFAFVRYTGGSNTSDRMVATIVHTPITLQNETQNLPANSWKGIPIQPPYNGNLDVTLSVVRGNPMDVYLVDSSQMDVMKRTADWRPIQGNAEFNATKTVTYHRSGQINQGTYFLVLRDTSLGIFSQSASDVSVKVVLNP